MISAFLDWPKRGISRNDYASITAEITVDPRGYASDCQARATAGNPNMAPYTCALLRQRSEFKPARDPAGHKIYGLHRSHFVWWNSDKPVDDVVIYDFVAHVGGNVPIEKADQLTRINYAVDTTGRVLSCWAGAADAKSALVAASCEQLPASLQKAVSDRKGKSVLSVQDAVVKVVE